MTLSFQLPRRLKFSTLFWVRKIVNFSTADQVSQEKAQLGELKDIAYLGRDKRATKVVNLESWGLDKYWLEEMAKNLHNDKSLLSLNLRSNNLKSNNMKSI